VDRLRKYVLIGAPTTRSRAAPPFTPRIGLLLNFFLERQITGWRWRRLRSPTACRSIWERSTFQRRITSNGTIYISVKTGHTMDSNGNGDDTQDYAVFERCLTRLPRRSLPGATTRALRLDILSPNAFYEAPKGLSGAPLRFLPEPDVVMFGLGLYRASNIYLSVIPSSQYLERCGLERKTMRRAISPV